MPDPAIQHQIEIISDALRVLFAGPVQEYSEYEILKALREQDIFQQPELDNTFSLFHQHFLLFHCLYRLQLELLQQQQGILVISPLSISRHAYQHSRQQQPAQHDPLCEYYLDLQHLHKTTAQDVDDLIRQFWQRLGNTEQRQQALATLGLSEQASTQEIKQRYRRLAMRHHPDRGGDAATLQLIHAAMKILAQG